MGGNQHQPGNVRFPNMGNMGIPDPGNMSNQGQGNMGPPNNMNAGKFFSFLFFLFVI